jgi:hypothetical protein
VEDLLNDLRERAADLEPFHPGLQWSAELLLTGRIQGKLLAGRTAVGTALEAGPGGLQLAVRGEEFARDQAKVPEQADKDGQGGLEGLGPHAAAEVAQIVLARNGVVQPRELARAAALVLLAQIGTEADRVGVAIHPAGQRQEQGAGGIIAVAPFFGIVRGKERAGEAEIDRGANEPAESPFDLTFRRNRNRAGLEVVVREPSIRALGERRGEVLQGALVQFRSLVHTRLQVKGGDALLGQCKFRSAHRGSSSKTGKVFGWSYNDAACPLGLTSPLAQEGR